MRRARNRDLVDMAALIGPAAAELSYLKLFRRRTSHYDSGVYRDINRCAVIAIDVISATSSGNSIPLMQHLKAGWQLNRCPWKW